MEGGIGAGGGKSQSGEPVPEDKVDRRPTVGADRNANYMDQGYIIAASCSCQFSHRAPLDAYSKF